MKKICTLLLCILVANAVDAQTTKPKKKNSDAAKDSIRAYVKVQKQPSPNDPFVLKMGVDSNFLAPVKMPNGYRSSNVEPIALPVEQLVAGKDTVKGFNIQNGRKNKKKRLK